MNDLNCFIAIMIYLGLVFACLAWEYRGNIRRYIYKPEMRKKSRKHSKRLSNIKRKEIIMRIRKYQLVGILEACQERGLVTIQEILDELKEFEDMKIVVETTKKK